MAPERPYTLKHAVLMSLVVIVATIVWIGWCVSIGLPFHPWSSIALMLAVFAVCYLFAGLDAFSNQQLKWFSNRIGWFGVVFIISAAILTQPGTAFPRWGVVAFVTMYSLFILVVLYFGVRSVLRVVSENNQRNKTDAKH